MALIKRRVLRAEGDLQIFMANLRYFKEALAKLRAEVRFVRHHLPRAGPVVLEVALNSR